MKPIRVGVLTVSDRVSRGEAEDRSGPLIEEWCAQRGHEVGRRAVVPDGTANLVPVLLRWADSGDLDLLITSGGTGLTERDCTPEATRAVVESRADGVADALRIHGRSKTPFAVLSRGEVGVRAHCLIVNLPGGPKGVRDGLEVLDSLVAHGAALVRGEDDSHAASIGTP